LVAAVFTLVREGTETYAEVVAGGEASDDALDALQDAVYAGAVGRIILPSLDLLGPDLMAQETILAGWVERGIGVFCRDEPDLGADDPARRQIRSALGSIEEFGKIPWVP
jgi:hypothetical protein